MSKSRTVAPKIGVQMLEFTLSVKWDAFGDASLPPLIYSNAERIDVPPEAVMEAVESGELKPLEIRPEGWLFDEAEFATFMMKWHLRSGGSFIVRAKVEH